MKLPTTSDGGGSGDGVNLPPLAQSTPQPSRATRHRIVADIDVPPAAGSEGPPASIPNDSLPHWELGYHVSERCAACQRKALAPLVLVCPCSLKHVLCASHLDLFGHTFLRFNSNEHNYRNETNPPQGRLKRRRQYSDGVNPTNIDDENPDPPGPSLGQGSQLEINPFGPTLSQGQVQYQSVGIQAGDPESTTHEDYLEAETSIYYTAINDSTVVPNAAGASFGGQPSLQVTPPNSPRARVCGSSSIRAATILAIPHRRPSSYQSSHSPLHVPGTIPVSLATEQAPNSGNTRFLSPSHSISTSDISDLSTFPSSQPCDGYSSEEDDPLENQQTEGSQPQDVLQVGDHGQGLRSTTGNDSEGGAGVSGNSLEGTQAADEDSDVSDISMSSS